MCLTIVFSFVESDASVGSHALIEAGRSFGLRLQTYQGSRGSNSRFLVSDTGGGCSCSMLVQRSSGAPDVWRLHELPRNGLANLIGRAASVVEFPFDFFITFSEEPSRTPTPIAPVALQLLVRENSVANGRLYRVAADEPANLLDATSPDSPPPE